MNIFSIIYFSQYYELKEKGKDPLKGRLNGTLLSAVVIMLNLVSLGLIVAAVSPHNLFVQKITDFFEGFSGDAKSTGKLLGLLLMIITGGLLWLTIGSKKGYLKIAERYMQLPDELQKKTIKQGLVIFLVSFAIFLFCIFLL